MTPFLTEKIDGNPSFLVKNMWISIVTTTQYIVYYIKQLNLQLTNTTESRRLGFDVWLEQTQGTNLNAKAFIEGETNCVQYFPSRKKLGHSNKLNTIDDVAKWPSFRSKQFILIKVMCISCS